MVLIFFLLTCIYFYPIFQGLILLPLDLLVTNFTPWNVLGEILVKNPFMQDAIMQMYPWKWFAQNMLKNGIIPLWNPYQFMGMPFMASLKPMVFYPLTYLMSLFPPVQAWNTLLFLQVFLSLVFTYLFARSLGITKIPSLLASLAFSLNSLMMAVLQFGSEGHVLLWAPLFLFCAKRYIDTKKSQFLLGVALGVCMSIVAGQLQYASYMFILLAAFIFWYGNNQKATRSTILLLFIAFGCGIGLSAIQLIPTLELFALSNRSGALSSDLFYESLLYPHELVRFLSPDIFGNPARGDEASNYIEHAGYLGIIPLFFAFWAMFHTKKNDFVKFFTVVFGLSILFSLKGPGALLALLHIPLISTGPGDRIISLVYISLSVLAGFGMMDFFRSTSTKIQRRFTVKFLALSLLFLLFTIFSYNIMMLHTVLKFSNCVFSIVLLLGFTALIFAATKWRRLIWLVMIIAVVLTYGDLFRIGYRFLTYSNPQYLYPEHELTNFIRTQTQHTLERTHGFLEPELATPLGVYTTETYNPLFPKSTKVFLDALLLHKDTGSRSKYQLRSGDPAAIKRTLDLLGVSYMVTKHNTSPTIEILGTELFQDRFTKVWEGEKNTVYKNHDAHPRFGLFYSFEVSENDEETLIKLTDASVDLQKTLLIDEQAPALMEGSGSATLQNTTPNTVSFSVTTTTPALLYLSDNYFPGWIARINGEEAHIYRANYAFRAVLIPTGTSTVHFSYEPMSFRMGLWVSTASAVGLLILAIWNTRFLRRGAAS